MLGRKGSCCGECGAPCDDARFDHVSHFAVRRCLESMDRGGLGSAVTTLAPLTHRASVRDRVGRDERTNRVVERGHGEVRDDLAEVFRRDYRAVVAVAARVLGSPDDAEDVAQETLLAFSRSDVPAAEARGWLCVAAAHTALNHLRSGRRRSAREEATGATADRAVPDIADTVLARDEHTRVRRALARLPRTQAVALVLRHSGLSYAEVAAALDLSPGSVGTTLRRAEAALRKELTDHA